MTWLVKLQQSFSFIQSNRQKDLQSIDLYPDSGTIKCDLKDGSVLYVRYNRYNQYSYNLIFSSIKYDRARFDNFDDKWNVSTSPHHFHPRYDKSAIESSMNGNPDHDLPLLMDYIRKQLLFDSKIKY